MLAACGSGSNAGGRDASGHDGSAPPPPPPAPLGCTAWPAPTGNVISVTPADAANLKSILASAVTGDTVSLDDGTYPTGGEILQLAVPGVTVRSKSGNREAVIIDGSYQGSEIFQVTASDVALVDLTIARAPTHPVHISGTGSDVTGVTVYNVHVLDPGEQGIKINSAGAWTDDGTIACSHVELTSAGQSHVSNCYTGGIDAHQSDGWHVYDNLIEGFWCASGLSEHGIHFWTGSRGTVIERNRVRNCARGIGLGLAPDSASSSTRTYPDSTACANVAGYGSVQHYDGVVRNNFVSVDDAAVFGSAAGFDNGIEIDAACNPQIFHNTVASTQAPSSSAIEWRFGSNPQLVNNLTAAMLKDRDGEGRASQDGNVSSAEPSWFVNLASGDLHLTSSASEAIATGSALSAGQCDDDIDGTARALATPSVGAHEY